MARRIVTEDQSEVLAPEERRYIAVGEIKCNGILYRSGDSFPETDTKIIQQLLSAGAIKETHHEGVF